MRIEKNPQDLQRELFGKTEIGFIPTMGAIHLGHLSLVQTARQENSFVVVSLFVNPAQFDDSIDFETYPLSLEKDLPLLKEQGVDIAFCPDKKSMYPNGYNYNVTEGDLSQKLCGCHRPGHFTSVLTIVLKLLNIVRAHRAYFGQKDYQQLQLIEKMVEAFFIPTEIVGCPTVRDKKGLALSSRNQKLSREGLKKAQDFAKILRETCTIKDIKQRLCSLGEVEVEYIEDVEDRRFAAVKIENIRLIDNVQL